MSGIRKYFPSILSVKAFLSKPVSSEDMSLEDAEVFSVSYLQSFVKFVEGNTIIQQFLSADKCNLLADNYLLAMTFAYFLRAKVQVNEFSSLNFFTALHIAHDMEEDEVVLKRNLCNWTSHSWEDEEAFYANRKTFLANMNFRACVSRQMCEKVMSIPETKHSSLWKRERLPDHAGASRPRNRILNTCVKCKEDDAVERRKRYYQPYGDGYQTQSTEKDRNSEATSEMRDSSDIITVEDSEDESDSEYERMVIEEERENKEVGNEKERENDGVKKEVQENKNTNKKDMCDEIDSKNEQIEDGNKKERRNEGVGKEKENEGFGKGVHDNNISNEEDICHEIGSEDKQREDGNKKGRRNEGVRKEDEGSNNTNEETVDQRGLCVKIDKEDGKEEEKEWKRVGQEDQINNNANKENVYPCQSCVGVSEMDRQMQASVDMKKETEKEVESKNNNEERSDCKVCTTEWSETREKRKQENGSDLGKDDEKDRSNKKREKNGNVFYDNIMEETVSEKCAKQKKDTPVILETGVNVNRNDGIADSRMICREKEANKMTEEDTSLLMKDKEVSNIVRKKNSERNEDIHRTKEKLDNDDRNDTEKENSDTNNTSKKLDFNAVSSIGSPLEIDVLISKDNTFKELSNEKLDTKDRNDYKKENSNTKTSEKLDSNTVSRESKRKNQETSREKLKDPQQLSVIPIGSPLELDVLICKDNTFKELSNGNLDTKDRNDYKKENPNTKTSEKLDSNTVSRESKRKNQETSREKLKDTQQSPVISMESQIEIKSLFSYENTSKKLSNDEKSDKKYTKDQTILLEVATNLLSEGKQTLGDSNNNNVKGQINKEDMIDKNFKGKQSSFMLKPNKKPLVINPVIDKTKEKVINNGKNYHSLRAQLILQNCVKDNKSVSSKTDTVVENINEVCATSNKNLINCNIASESRLTERAQNENLIENIEAQKENTGGKQSLVNKKQLADWRDLNESCNLIVEEFEKHDNLDVAQKAQPKNTDTKQVEKLPKTNYLKPSQKLTPNHLELKTSESKTVSCNLDNRQQRIIENYRTLDSIVLFNRIDIATTRNRIVSGNINEKCDKSHNQRTLQKHKSDNLNKDTSKQKAQQKKDLENDDIKRRKFDTPDIMTDILINKLISKIRMDPQIQKTSNNQGRNKLKLGEKSKEKEDLERGVTVNNEAEGKNALQKEQKEAKGKTNMKNSKEKVINKKLTLNNSNEAPKALKMTLGMEITQKTEIPTKITPKTVVDVKKAVDDDTQNEKQMTTPNINSQVKHISDDQKEENHLNRPQRILETINKFYDHELKLIQSSKVKKTSTLRFLKQIREELEMKTELHKENASLKENINVCSENIVQDTSENHDFMLIRDDGIETINSPPKRNEYDETILGKSIKEISTGTEKTIIVAAETQDRPTNVLEKRKDQVDASINKSIGKVLQNTMAKEIPDNVDDNNNSKIGGNGPRNSILFHNTNHAQDQVNQIEIRQDHVKSISNSKPHQTLEVVEKLTRQLSEKPLEFPIKSSQSTISYSNALTSTVMNKTSSELAKSQVSLALQNSTFAEQSIEPNNTLNNEQIKTKSPLDLPNSTLAVRNVTISSLAPLVSAFTEIKDILLQNQTEIKRINEKINTLDERVSNKRKLQWEDSSNPQKLAKIDQETAIDGKSKDERKDTVVDNRSYEDEDVIFIEEKIVTKHNIQMVRFSNANASFLPRPIKQERIDTNHQNKLENHSKKSIGDTKIPPKIIIPSRTLQRKQSRTTATSLSTVAAHRSSKVKQVWIRICEDPESKEEYLHLKIKNSRSGRK